MLRPLPLLLVLGALACGTKASPEKVASRTGAASIEEADTKDAPRTKAPAASDARAFETTRKMVEGLNRFTIDLHRVAAAREADSVLSPASVALGLGMVHAGARGETATEIETALHVQGEPTLLHTAFGELLRRWNGGTAGVELAVVDRMFGDTSVAFDRAWVDLGAEVFGAPMQLMNFQGAPDASRSEINAWVARETKDRIVDLLPPQSITSASKLVVVNVVYFKGAWAQAFDPKDTRPGEFATKVGKRAVPMMHRVGEVAHASIPEAKLALVQLPYVAEAVALVVLLPDAPHGLPALEAELDIAALEGWIGKAATKKVDLALPKLRVQMDAPLLLKAPLTALGIRRVFDPAQADLTGIAAAEEKLHIDEGYHEAFLELDETGTEAAAASAGALIPGGAATQDSPVVFHADRPFLYLLRDTQTGAILFIGHVVSPSAT